MSINRLVVRINSIFVLLLTLSTFLMPSAIYAQRQSFMVKQVPEAVSSGNSLAVGDVEPSHVFKLAISLPLRNQTDLQLLLSKINDPSSPEFKHYLTSSDFTTSFGPSEDDYNLLVAWAQEKGFKIKRTTQGRRLLDIEGDTDTVSHAFGISMKKYFDSRKGRIFFAPSTEPTVDLGVSLLSISGLDNANPPETLLRRDNRKAHSSISGFSGSGVLARTGSGPSGNYLPSDMRAAYYGYGSLSGGGQSVAILSFDGYLTSDLALYYSYIGQAQPSVAVTNVLERVS